ncbi:MAG: hypothetical protein WD824_19665 [Cyclobacteriaceae bacterium]
MLTEYLNFWQGIDLQGGFTADQEKRIKVLCDKKKLDLNEIRRITFLIKKIGRIPHTSIQQIKDETQKFLSLIDSMDLWETDLKKIKFEFSNGKDFTLSKETLDDDRLKSSAFLFIERLKEQLASPIHRKRFTPRSKRKGKALGLDGAKRELALQIVKHLKSKKQLKLKEKEIGDVVVILFKISGSPLHNYKSGTIAYDTISRTR